MAELSEKAIQDAERLVSQIMERGLNSDVSSIEKDIVFSDLQTDSVQYKQDLEILRQLDRRAPAIRVADEEFIPMSLETFVGRSLPMKVMKSLRLEGGHTPFRKEFYDAFERQQKQDEHFVELIDHEVARKTFIRRAVNFLATRITAVRNFRERGPGNWFGQYSFMKISQSYGEPDMDTPGCLFTVSTNTRNLSVIVTGAYNISFRNFQHPTSPVSEYIQSGTYIFGVIGRPYQNLKYDPNIVVVLPGTPSVHLHY